MPIHERTSWRRVAWLAIAGWTLSLVLPAVWVRPDGVVSSDIIFSGWQALHLCLVADGPREHLGPTALLRAMALSNLVMVAALVMLPLRRPRWAVLALGLASLAASILDISVLAWMPTIPFSIGYWVWIASFATLAAACLGRWRFS
jgi:hypothetical protein